MMAVEEVAVEEDDDKWQTQWDAVQPVLVAFVVLGAAAATAADWTTTMLFRLDVISFRGVLERKNKMITININWRG